MTTEAIPLRRSLIGSVLDHNPFYLLSALCMLAGCVALTNSLSYIPLRLPRLLLLIATLNLYEIMLVGLAIFLIARRNLLRDGKMLLSIEAVFLVDAAFLNAEIFAADVKVGLLANAALLLLAAGKLAAVFWALGLPLRGVAFPMIVGQLAMLYAIPGVFRAVSQDHDGVLPPLVVYAAWWAVAMLPILLSLVLRGRDFDDTTPAAMALHRHRRLVGLLLVLPIVSILVHLCTQNWVYNVRWYAANSTPLLLGLAVAVGMYDRHVTNMTARMRTQLLLPVLAIIGSLSTPGQLVFDLAGVTFTPLRLTLLGAAAVYAHGLWVHRHAYFAWAGAMCLAVVGLGETPAAMMRNMHYIVQEATSHSSRLVPRTRTHWGITAVGASFVLFVIGALVSLLHSRSVAVSQTVPAQQQEDEII